MNDAERPLSLHTAVERPDLWERGIPSDRVWPEYNLHGDVVNQWWGLLDEEMADFQFVLYDEEADVVAAEGHTAPIRWDGEDARLPDSFDATLVPPFQTVNDALSNTLIPNAQNAELKSLLQSGLKLFQSHLDHAEHLAAQLQSAKS